jgi:hypothetical protein
MLLNNIAVVWLNSCGTPPRLGQVACECPISVTITTFALVIFHTELVCSDQQVMGPRLKSLTRDNFVRRAAIDNSPAEGKLT